MSSPEKTLEDQAEGPTLDQDDTNDVVDKDTSPSSPVSSPVQTTSPTILKSAPDDADTSSSLSAAPSPLTTAHRPTSSKTSIDNDQPLTPLDIPEKSSQGKEPEPKEEPATIKQVEPVPTEKPVEKPTLPEDKLGTILKLNAELINVYNEFHSRELITTHPSEFQQYSHRIQVNIQWLTQYQESLGTPFASRIPLQIMHPPPTVPFTSIDHIKALYTHLASLFKRDEIRDMRKRELRGMMSGISASNPIDVSVNVNINGKRERTDDDHPDEGAGVGGSGSGGHSPRKRVDTGESKSTAGVSSPATSLHASTSVSPERMNALPSNPHAAPHSGGTPAPGAPGGPLRPSSSQSNSSNNAVATPTSASSMLPPGVIGGPAGMTPMQMERMRMVAQQNRNRGGNGSAGSMGMMVGQPGQPGQPGQMGHPGQQPSHQNNGSAPAPPFGIAPRPVPPTILPQLLNMIRNPQAHQSVQLLHAKIPDFRNMQPEQQAGVLWAFQQNQMRQQQEMQQRQNMQIQMQGGGGGGQMPGQGQMQMQGGGGQGGGGGFQPGAPQPNAMRPPSAGAGGPTAMQPPPSPHSIQQQRQLNLMQQQQAAAMGRGAPPGMPVGYPVGMNGAGGPGGGMNMNQGMGMGSMGMGGGGHARMPSNPTMGPPPVPMSASSSQMYQGGGGMNPYPQHQPQQPGINPMNLAYPMQQQQQQQQHQQQQQQHQQQQQMYGNGMAGSPPNSGNGNSSAWSPPHSQQLTPAAIMQQQQAKLAGMSPGPTGGGAPGPGGPGNGNGGPGSMDPNAIVNWQDLAAT